MSNTESLISHLLPSAYPSLLGSHHLGKQQASLFFQLVKPLIDPLALSIFFFPNPSVSPANSTSKIHPYLSLYCHHPSQSHHHVLFPGYLPQWSPTQFFVCLCFFFCLCFYSSPEHSLQNELSKMWTRSFYPPSVVSRVWNTLLCLFGVLWGLASTYLSRLLPLVILLSCSLCSSCFALLVILGTLQAQPLRLRPCHVFSFDHPYFSLFRLHTSHISACHLAWEPLSDYPGLESVSYILYYRTVVPLFIILLLEDFLYSPSTRL